MAFNADTYRLDARPAIKALLERGLVRPIIVDVPAVRAMHRLYWHLTHYRRAYEIQAVTDQARYSTLSFERILPTDKNPPGLWLGVREHTWKARDAETGEAVDVGQS